MPDWVYVVRVWRDAPGYRERFKYLPADEQEWASLRVLGFGICWGKVRKGDAPE